MSTYKSLGHSIAKNGEKMTHEETADELNRLKNRLNQLEAQESETRSETTNVAKFSWLRTPWFVAGILAILVIVMILNVTDITVGDVAGWVFIFFKSIALVGVWILGLLVGIVLLLAIVFGLWKVIPMIWGWLKTAWRNAMSSKPRENT